MVATVVAASMGSFDVSEGSWLTDCVDIDWLAPVALENGLAPDLLVFLCHELIAVDDVCLLFYINPSRRAVRDHHGSGAGSQRRDII